MIIFKHFLWMLNSCLGFIVFIILKILFNRKPQNGSGIIFINTGSLGDVIISSIILDNYNISQNEGEIFFVVKSMYSELFENYRGDVKIIFWDNKKYKWSIVYRIKFLNNLRNNKSNMCINLTSSRGISSDEISLLSGSSIIWSFANSWKTIKKAFPNRMDSYYDKILFRDIVNEYERHERLLHILFNEPILYKSKISLLNDSSICENYIEGKYIVIAPCASEKAKKWGDEKYGSFCSEISKYVKVILIGTMKEKSLIEKIKGNADNVINLAGELKLNELLLLIKNASLFVGNDSGPAHIAYKFEIPMIVIIGGGTFKKYFPYNESKHRVFLCNFMDCFGCEWECRYKERFCLTNVKTDDVLIKAINIIRTDIDA